MHVLETRLDGPKLIEPDVHGDARGFFQETYRAEAYEGVGISEQFLQDNHSRSRRGVLRGLHYTIGSGASKLIRCSRGAIVDVVVDLRRGSPTFAEWEAFELDDVRCRQIYCPVGFAHGFVVTSEIADVVYKVSEYYSPATERGIAYDDRHVRVEWPADLELVVSERDRTAPSLDEARAELPFVYDDREGP